MRVQNTISKWTASLVNTRQAGCFWHFLNRKVEEKINRFCVKKLSKYAKKRKLLVICEKTVKKIAIRWIRCYNLS
jgi:hypothetical protein